MTANAQTTQGRSRFSRSENRTAPFRGTLRLFLRRITAALILALPLGCGSDEPPVTPVSEARDAPDVPPGEIRRMLDGLNSDNPRTQYGAMKMLSQFPAVVETYREQVERLEKESKDERIRKKAAELLAAIEKPIESE
jgi:hypothetical protein